MKPLASFGITAGGPKIEVFQDPTADRCTCLLTFPVGGLDLAEALQPPLEFVCHKAIAAAVQLHVALEELHRTRSPK